MVTQTQPTIDTPTLYIQMPNGKFARLVKKIIHIAKFEVKNHLIQMILELAGKDMSDGE